MPTVKESLLALKKEEQDRQAAILKQREIDAANAKYRMESAREKVLAALEGFTVIDMSDKWREQIKVIFEDTETIIRVQFKPATHSVRYCDDYGPEDVQVIEIIIHVGDDSPFRKSATTTSPEGFSVAFAKVLQSTGLDRKI